MLRSLACSIVLLHALAPAPRAHEPQPPVAPTVVIIVRHAEKDTTVEGNDPPLSETGRRRAERLADIGAGAGVGVVFTTQLRRTQETSRPLIARLGVPTRSFQITRETVNEHVSAVAKEIGTNQKGKTVLVVGHSNTAARVAAALTGKTIPDLDDATEFDALFVVIIPESGAATLVRAKY